MCWWRWEQGDETHRDTLSQVSGFPDPGAPLGFTPGRRACTVLGTETKSWARVRIAGQFRTASHRAELSAAECRHWAVSVEHCAALKTGARQPGQLLGGSQTRATVEPAAEEHFLQDAMQTGTSYKSGE